MHCLSYRMLNLFTNWLMSLQPFVIIPKYAMRPKSLHCWNKQKMVKFRIFSLQFFSSPKNVDCVVEIWYERYKNQHGNWACREQANGDPTNKQLGELRDFLSARHSVPPGHTAAPALPSNAAFLWRCVEPRDAPRLKDQNLFDFSFFFFFQKWISKWTEKKHFHEIKKEWN